MEYICPDPTTKGRTFIKMHTSSDFFLKRNNIRKDRVLNDLKIKFSSYKIPDKIEIIKRFEKMEKESDDFFEGINKGLITLLIFRKRNNLFKTLFEEAEILRNKSLVNSIRYIEQDVIDYIKRKLEKAEHRKNARAASQQLVR